MSENKDKRVVGIIWLYDDNTHQYDPVKPKPNTDSIGNSLWEYLKSNIRKGIKHSPH